MTTYSSSDEKSEHARETLSACARRSSGGTVSAAALAARRHRPPRIRAAVGPTPRRGRRGREKPVDAPVAEHGTPPHPASACRKRTGNASGCAFRRPPAARPLRHCPRPPRRSRSSKGKSVRKAFEIHCVACDKEIFHRKKTFLRKIIALPFLPETVSYKSCRRVAPFPHRLQEPLPSALHGKERRIQYHDAPEAF